MKRTALKIGYIGTNFHGFQRQPDLRTVEEELIYHLRKLGYIDDLKKSRFRIAGRTDAGVHSLGNVISFQSEKEVRVNEINNSLPDDIQILAKAPVRFGFKPRYAEMRQYRYLLFRDDLDIDKLNEVAEVFKGTHNFTNFTKRFQKTTTRTIADIKIRVLFYNSENDFAVMLKTNTKDRIILYRTNSNENFEDTFEKINNKSKNYINYKFSYKDTIKIPNLSFNIFKSYDDIKEKTFIRNRDNEPFEINEAMQTIEFELDKAGGRIKSEAVIEMTETAIRRPKEEHRHFNFDDTFYLFLIEEEKEKPYFAARIQDIENFIK